MKGKGREEKENEVGEGKGDSGGWEVIVKVIKRKVR